MVFMVLFSLMTDKSQQCITPVVVVVEDNEKCNPCKDIGGLNNSSKGTVGLTFELRSLW